MDAFSAFQVLGNQNIILRRGKWTKDKVEFRALKISSSYSRYLGYHDVTCVITSVIITYITLVARRFRVAIFRIERRRSKDRLYSFLEFVLKFAYLP